MASYYIATDVGLTNDRFSTRKQAEKIARFVRRNSKLATRVLLRCDPQFSSVQFGPDSEWHVGLHYSVVARFPVAA